MPTLTLPDGAVYTTGDPVEPAAKAAWDGATIAGRIIKANDDQRYTLTIAYAPDLPDVGKARDGHRDFANADEVRKAAHSFMRNGARLGILHADGTEGAGQTVESYVWPDGAPDWTMTATDGSEVVVKSGYWMHGAVWDEPTWERFRNGEFGGVSMQGGAKRRAPSPADVARVKARA